MDYKQEIKDCSCGRRHYCPIEGIFIGRNALADIPLILEKYEHILVVCDENTKKACADRVLDILGNRRLQIITKVLNSGTEGVVIPDEKSIYAIQAAMPDSCDVIVGVGSGVINDLCKYVSFVSKIPYLIVATAPSMDGYASAGSALILKGMKVTVNTHVPRWIVGDSDVLSKAPADMIRAGAGDIIGKISCLNDWKLSHLINGEYYCDRIADIVSAEVRKTIEHADLFLTRDPLAIQNLMESLVKVGIAMAYVGNSRPASGSEHHLAHFFEITGILNHSPYLSHGIDVAYGTVITSNLRTRLAQMNPTSFVRLSVQEESRKNWEEAIQEVFGSLSTSVISLQEQAGLYQKNRFREVCSQWKNIQKILSEVPDGITVMKILKRMGFQSEEFTQLYGSEKIRKAVEFAKDLKDRYSLLWLLNDVGMLHTMAYEDCVFNGFSDESW